MKFLVHKIVVWCISGCILALRSLLGPATCRFEIGCTQFALMQLQEQSFITACLHIGKRLLSCSPIFKCKEI